jgi:hypothetical protein
LMDFVQEAVVAHVEQEGCEPPSHLQSSLHYAVQQQCGAITAEVLLLHDTSYVWDRLFDKVVKPAIAMVLTTSAGSDSARPCREIYEAIKQLTADTLPPGRLLAQLKLFQSRVAGFWDRMQTHHQMRSQQEAQRQSAQALLALAAASRGALPGGYGRPALGSSSVEGGGQLFLALKAKDEEFQGKPAAERGCKFWSGMEGSCRRGAACPDRAMHVQGQPSPWYAARGKVWAAHGGVKGDLGNWTLPKLSGVKRPAPGGGEGGAEAFRSPM